MINVGYIQRGFRKPPLGKFSSSELNLKKDHAEVCGAKIREEKENKPS